MDNNNYKTLCIIPARSGSKRLPNKNRLNFHGKLLYEWSIAAALKSNLINTICLSTDDAKIIIKERKNKKIKLHIRNNSLAKDNSSIEDLCDQLLEEFKKESIFFSHILLLQPTSPLRESNLIDHCIKLCYSELNATGLIELDTIKICSGKIEKNIWIPDNPPDLQSQFVKKTFIPSGRIFIYKINSENKIFRSNYYALESNNKFQNNIDYPEDFRKAEKLFLDFRDEFEYLLNDKISQ